MVGDANTWWHALRRSCPPASAKPKPPPLLRSAAHTTKHLLEISLNAPSLAGVSSAAQDA
jgi:hypothetical protein